MKWLKNIKTKFQIFLLLIGTIFSAFLFFKMRGNFRLKRQIQYQLEKVRKETELLELEKDSQEKEKQLLSLKKQEQELLKKINLIEEKEIKGEEISLEELEDFFNKRGF